MHFISLRPISIGLLLLMACLLSLTQAFDFFQLFEEAENAARQQKPRPTPDQKEFDKGSKSQTSQPTATQFCSGYACPGAASACVAKPGDCPCPFGYVKFPLQDWYACIRKDQMGRDFKWASK